MEYSIEYLEDKNVVVVKMKGRLNFHIAEQYSKDAVKLAHQNSCARFVLDHTETVMHEGVYKIHVDGEELQQFGFKNTDRIAIIIIKPDDTFVGLKSESHNSRWCIVKYFYLDNSEEALNWLLEK